MIGRPAVPLEKRIFGALEILFTMGGFLVLSWTFGLHVADAGLGLHVGALFAIFVLYAGYLSPVFLHQDSLERRGLGSLRTAFVRTDNFFPAARRFGWMTFWIGFGLIGWALIRNPRVFFEIRPEAVVLKFGFYLISAFVQGLILIGFLMNRIADLFPVREGDPASFRRGRFGTSLVTGLIFAAFHLPNPPLMILTFLMGSSMIWISYTTPNLVVMAGCHALLGTILHRVVQIHMRIGPFYHRPDVYAIRHFIPGVKELIGDRF
ncbi:MAG: hypothetical protein U1E27_04800 [Kiritimatiellia bacterium]|nr:hypothetical protein [Kiritimatiellia bacterium]